MAAILTPSPSPPLNFLPKTTFSAPFASIPLHRKPPSYRFIPLSAQLSDQTATITPSATRIHRIDKSRLCVSESSSDDELWAAARLRVRSFYNFNEQTFGIEDHKRYLAEQEYEAVKERISGIRKGFRKVSCISATLPVSALSSVSDELCSACKFSQNGEDRVVVGTLDLNQCLSLPDEICGSKPKGPGADFARAYITNVCVAKELHRNGLGYDIIAESKIVAEDWGISDLYVHVAVDNDAAKNLYLKSGFTLESEEPAWQARFLDRPRRLLLWMGLPISYEL